MKITSKKRKMKIAEMEHQELNTHFPPRPQDEAPTETISPISSLGVDDSQIKIRAKEITLLPIEEIKLNPKNRNSHPEDQIEDLAKIIKYQGFRDPIILSNQSQVTPAGEGRFLAAMKLGMKEVPVIFQDFDDAEQEYLYGISNNAIASRSHLDFTSIHTDIADMGPFDTILLGIKDFNFEPTPIELPSDEERQQEENAKMVECPRCGKCFDAKDNKMESIK